MYRLSFDEETHAYSLGRGGNYPPLPIPSVTQVLQENGLYSSYARNNNSLIAMGRGRHIHKITELYDQGLVGPMDVDGEEAGYLSAYRSFITEHQFVPTTIEKKLFHPAYLYAGTIDRVGTLVIDKEEIKAVIDIKTGEPHPATNLQLSAYLQMAVANGSKATHVFALHIDSTGKYRLLPDPNPDFSFHVFLAALTMFNWRKSLVR